MAALIWIAPNLRAIHAAHVALQFMDRRRLGSADDVERYSLMRVATEAPHFKVQISLITPISLRIENYHQVLPPDSRKSQ